MGNEKIDLLRFIGLAMIIFAHVNPPSILLQLRTFDVPLMIIVSAMSFSLGYKDEPYIQYLWKRIKRLVFHVWIFLTGYFLTILIFSPSAKVLNFKTLFDSYFFFGGIGYVWIIRIFILLALTIVFIQVWLIQNMLMSKVQNKTVQKNLKILFTG